MKITSLEDLMIEQLRDLYSAETQLVKALPKMAKSATSAELRAGFQEHLEQTKGHVQRLEQIFDQLGAKAKGKKCAAMEGLVEEGKELMDEDIAGAVLDAGLICAAQKVEHYEIASYGCVVTWARQLDEEEIADLLQKTLDEEKETNERLTQLAESTVNAEAEEGEEDEEAAMKGPARGAKGGSSRTPRR